MKVISSIYPSQEIQADIRREFPDIEFSFYKGLEYLPDEWSNAEVFITLGEDLTDEYIEKASRLKWIMVMSAGMEKMPFQACKEKGILVTNAKGIHKTPMAEFTIGTMLQHAKKMKKLWMNEEKHIWDRRIPMAELYEQTLIILGIGAIGGEIARLAKAFGMNVIGFNRSGECNEYANETYQLKKLDNHIHRADYLVAVLPSMNETKHFLEESHFMKMKNNAVFINIGRGDLVPSELLIKVMKEQQIQHAYLDVFEKEPLEEGHPFWDIDNITVTPHLSSITKMYMPRSFEILKHNLHTYIKNKTNFINVIDLGKGY